MRGVLLYFKGELNFKMFKEKKKTSKNKGSYVLCKNCNKRVYINDEDTKLNTTVIAKKLIYDCECGEQVILE